ncbi:DsrE family protein [Marinomonas communis]|jgi:tRNA 2-thiouridine synthesizing protein C|uniref:DsrE family protein n=1 Tax=Marinomonas communis TaxID=28254 RepID=UPI001D17E599|nr:DsrE family protein [Marinomonas communis]MCC4272889.1 DsrE family protein [Marinomonas communis]
MSTLIYLSSSPYTSSSLKEALDLALVFGTFEQAVSIAITGDALTLLAEDQTPTKRQGKHLYKLLDGLEFYDIENIYVKETEVKAFGTSLWTGVQAISQEAWIDMLEQHQHIYRF